MAPSRTPPDKNLAPDSVEALVRASEAHVRLEAAVSGLSKDFSELRGELRSDRNTIGSKLDNLDRSTQELRFSLDQLKDALVKQLDEERKDRRKAVSEGLEAVGQSGQDARALVKKLIEEELGAKAATRADQKETRSLIVGAAKAVWDKGGQWVVAAICLLIVLQLKTCSGSGFDLSNILGGK